MTAPDGRIWTVAREDIAPREKTPRPYPHELDEGGVDRFTFLLWGVPCAVIIFLVAGVAVVAVLSAAALAVGGYVVDRYRLHQRRHGRAAWTIRASTPPTEYEHGIAYAWAVMGGAASERAVHACADAIDGGVPPERLAPGPPITP